MPKEKLLLREVQHKCRRKKVLEDIPTLTQFITIAMC